MAFQGEYFRDRYGRDETKPTPPIREILQTRLPAGAGTVATRVATYNQFVSLYWMITGKTVGALSMYTDDNRLDRMKARRVPLLQVNWRTSRCFPPTTFQLRTRRSSASSPCSQFGGRPVYAAEEFADLAPPRPPVLPEWSQVATYGGYFKPTATPASVHSTMMHSHQCEHHRQDRQIGGGIGCLCWAF
jgi:hypothetical protein